MPTQWGSAPRDGWLGNAVEAGEGLQMCWTTLASYATANEGTGTGRPLLNAHVSLVPLPGCRVRQL